MGRLMCAAGLILIASACAAMPPAASSPTGGVGAPSAAAGQGATAGIRQASIVSQGELRRMIAAPGAAVVLFAAAGCGSCVGQARTMALAARGRTVRLLGVDIGQYDDASTFRQFMEATGMAELPMTWTVDKDGTLAAAYKVQALSTTVGLRDGSVRFSNAREVDPDELRRQMATL